jgi:ceramide glucosyltransferase
MYWADRYRYRHYSAVPASAVSIDLPEHDIPHVTVIRPVKGLEPQLYECLAATFRQNYPGDKLTIYFCVSSKNDSAYPTLQRLLQDFPNFDARIYLEEDDPNLSGRDGEEHNLGPNPKIRNMSRAYREAKSDIVWIIDCNVWVSNGAAGRMVDRLCGFLPEGKRTTPYKFAHHIPLVVDSVGASAEQESRGLLSNQSQEEDEQEIDFNATEAPKGLWKTGGGRLEEMFMASSHAKFYTAINTVAVAPCIVGKSNMFRRSHLNALTSTSSSYSPGIDFFSDNICEDHLIGDLLWKKKVQAELSGEKWGKHALIFGDIALQPMAGMSVREYTARRIRWLRVRKWTVTLATLVEPGVESLLCSAYAAFALTTLPFFQNLGIPQTWTAFAICWLLCVLVWITVDWLVYKKLHSASSVEHNSEIPSFARPPAGGQRRPFKEWIAAWLGREILALPVWTYAVLGGTTVKWRNKMFWVGMDMKVHEIQPRDHGSRNGSVPVSSECMNKTRRD